MVRQLIDTVSFRLLSLEEAEKLCIQAALKQGASPQTALSLARSVVSAEAEGQANLGLSHFVDYLEALKAGRIKGDAEPEISRPVPAAILSDAKGGAAHTGFDLAFADLLSTARHFGLCLFLQRGAFTCGALGYFARRIAEEGLVALAATNGPALLAGSGSRVPVYCTNPMAFAAPQTDGPALVIDQSSSATAFVSIRKAAAEGRSLPDGWALDAEGKPTNDAGAALKGALLAFGGARGANMALMVEILSAGLTGANWSLDAPSYSEGGESPGSGLFILAIAPELAGPDFQSRMQAQSERLSGRYNVHIPGVAKIKALAAARRDGMRVDEATLRLIESFL